METIFLNLLTPELVNITKPKYNKLISYGYFFDFKLVYSLAWIYKYYFEISILLFLPKCVNIKETLSTFNEIVGDYPLTQEEILYCSLESIEVVSVKCSSIIIFGFGDFIFNELSILNKRRINTRLRALKCKITILSYTPLKVIDLIAFDTFEFLQMKNESLFDKSNFNYIDFLDPDPEIYEMNVESLVEFISENKESSIYLSLNLPTSKIIQIEEVLKDRNINVSRKETTCHGVVINASKTIAKSFLKNKYQIYIFITQKFDYPLDLLFYLKEIGNNCCYIDSSKIKNIEHSLKSITSEIENERTVINESNEFESYKEINLILNLENTNVSENTVVVSENYYRFDAPESIQKMNLSNLTKKDYDTIRNFVKLKLNVKFDLDIKTCQLSAPCSPKDRSKKLNSLSNKISSYNYRCDITCEIFKDYTIGVILWNEIFSNRKPLPNLKNQTFIYQTTSGMWKYTTVK